MLLGLELGRSCKDLNHFKIHHGHLIFANHEATQTGYEPYGFSLCRSRTVYEYPDCQ